MTHPVTQKSWSWLLALAFGLALGLSACQQSQEPPAKAQTTNTTNTAAPTKAPEHPEHPK